MAKFKKIIFSAILIVMIATAGYILFLSIYPRVDYLANKQKFAKAQIIDEPAQSEEEQIPTTTEKILTIPKLGLKEHIFQGDDTALDKGIWHKYSDSSDPIIGGNFVLVGHRFNFGVTPGETKRKSPLYNIEELEVGDEIIISWNGETYKYLVNEKFNVTPTQIEIEENTSQAQLTLYTCTLEGRYDGRVVIIAKPIHNKGA